MSPTSSTAPASRKTSHKTATRSKPAAATRLVVLVATRKGAWFFHGDAGRKAWKADGPHFLGHTISHVQLDPRDGRTLLAAAKTGHLGPTIFRSTNLGRTWKEARQPPAFAAPTGGLPARSVDHTFWLTPGHASERGTWYAGTSPQGLFRSEDGGVSWAPLPAVNDDAQFREWMGTVQDGTPDGPKLHSVIVDPRDPSHLYFAMSGGGVHESRDAGRSWATLIKGLEVVEGGDTGTSLSTTPIACGCAPATPTGCTSRTTAASTASTGRPGSRRPIGRQLAAHRPQDAQARGRHRLSHGRAPARCRHGLGLSDGRHHRLATHQPRRAPGGLRHAQRRPHLAAAGPGPARKPGLVDREAPGDDGDALAAPALYLGTTSGELWIGRDEGARWSNIARHLPEIYAVEVAELP
jgi:photosystem II stability/assembly factor-like uncharacterized protein